MARIVGIEIPGDKRIDIALRYIYGIGPSNAKVVLAKAQIDPSIRAKDLSEAQMSQILPCHPGRQIRHRRRSCAGNWA